MKWLQEEAKNRIVSENKKFVRFSNGKGNNKKAIHLYLSKALFDEANEKGYNYIRIGVDEKDGQKILGFNLNKSYGGIELKNKNGGYRKVFNINRYLKAFQDEGVELPMNEQLEVEKDGQNYIYVLK